MEILKTTRGKLLNNQWNTEPLPNEKDSFFSAPGDDGDDATRAVVLLLRPSPTRRSASGAASHGAH
eukprot:2265399-Pyramimonas_sp.AAC.1